MTRIIKETVTTETNLPLVRTYRTSSNQLFLKNLVYYILGIVEFLLTLRLVLRVLGANPGSYFVSLIYLLTRPLIWPFLGIFQQAYNQGIDATSVLEPATLVAIIVYAFIASGIVKLVTMDSPNPG